MRPKYGGNGQGPLETLDEPLYVSSPLGIKARIGMICRGCRVGDLWDSTHSGPDNYGHVRVRCHLGNGLADSLQGSLSIVSVGGLPSTSRTVLVWYFRGDKHDIFPQTIYDSRCQGKLVGWLASLTLEDEERPDLDLPRVVCDYMDVFPYELPGLPPQRVVDFGIELRPGISPIYMTPHRMGLVELQELRVQLQELTGQGVH